jgi:hypothetical protein
MPNFDELEKEFTSKRDSEVCREASLFKVLFSATIVFTIDGDLKQQLTGISKFPIYDKGKYELKGKEITPNIICDNRPFKINLLVPTSLFIRFFT